MIDGYKSDIFTVKCTIWFHTRSDWYTWYAILIVWNYKASRRITSKICRSKIISVTNGISCIQVEVYRIFVWAQVSEVAAPPANISAAFPGQA